MIFTSRYANSELRSCKYTAVRISIGLPKWKLGYEIAGAIDELMPKGIFRIKDYDEFHRLYFERLDAIGIDIIREKLRHFDETQLIRATVKSDVSNTTDYLDAFHKCQNP